MVVALGMAAGAAGGLSGAMAVPVAKPVALSPVILGHPTPVAKRILAKFGGDRVTLHLKNTPAEKVFQLLCQKGGVKMKVVKE